MLRDLGRWVAVLGFALMGLAGLFYSAHGATEQAYPMGLGAFFAAVAAITVLVRRALDDADAGNPS